MPSPDPATDAQAPAPPKDDAPETRGGVFFQLLRLPTITDIKRDIAMFRQLLHATEIRVWFLPTMIVLAFLSALFEGASLALLIPLVQVLASTAGPSFSSGVLAKLSALLTAVPEASRIPVILVAIVVAVGAKLLVSYVNLVVLAVVYGRLSHRLRTGVFSKLLAVPLARVEGERSGKYLNVLNNETWRATDALTNLFTMLTSFTTATVFFALLVMLSAKLSFLALSCMAIIPPLIHVISQRAKHLSNLGLVANEQLAQQTWSTLNGLRTIHSFGRESFETNRFTLASDRVRHLFLRSALVTMTTGPVTELLVTTIVGLLVFFVDASHVNIAALVGFLAILHRLQPRLLALVAAQSNINSLHASVRAVSEILASDTMAQPKGGARPFERLNQTIAFDHVTFTYAGAPRPAISDLSATIRQGSMVAIVGASGAGKSTLLDLLLGFQAPQTGVIRVDDVDLNAFDLKTWRARIGVVSQDPYVFDDTVRANILFGRPDASEDELRAAARAACADDFISALPNGYDTLVGERGTQISGGQRQRLALARALLRDPDILLLDEATNALDTATERALQQALTRFAERRTVIIVAHRFATIEGADHVLVLEDGRLTEQGRPRALLDAGGPFAQMFAGQAPSPPDLSSKVRSRAS